MKNSLGNTVSCNNEMFFPMLKFSGRQWYMTDTELLNDERAAMRMKYPSAVEGRLSDGRMTWTLKLPHILCDTIPGRDTNTWELLLVYDADHPSVSANSQATKYRERYAGSIKIYPLSPTVAQLQSRASKYGRSFVPHLLEDEFGNRYLCTFRPQDFKAGMRAGEAVLSGANAFTQAIKWATHYELGLKDDAIWKKFCEH